MFFFAKLFFPLTIQDLKFKINFCYLFFEVYVKGLLARVLLHASLLENSEEKISTGVSKYGQCANHSQWSFIQWALTAEAIIKSKVTL